MGLLEYYAMPSLLDAAHDGVLCTFSNRRAPDRGNWCGPSCRAGGMNRPSCTKTHSAGSLSSSQSGGPPCWASPLAFGLIVRYPLFPLPASLSFIPNTGGLADNFYSFERRLGIALIKIIIQFCKNVLKVHKASRIFNVKKLAFR